MKAPLELNPTRAKRLSMPAYFLSTPPSRPDPSILWRIIANSPLLGTSREARDANILQPKLRVALVEGPNDHSPKPRRLHSIANHHQPKRIPILEQSQQVQLVPAAAEPLPEAVLVLPEPRVALARGPETPPVVRKLVAVASEPPKQGRFQKCSFRQLCQCC
jgi:hypothetical protein